MTTKEFETLWGSVIEPLADIPLFLGIVDEDKRSITPDAFTIDRISRVATLNGEYIDITIKPLHDDREEGGNTCS